MIVSDGITVSEAHVENVFREHSVVSEVGVVGIPDGWRGERVAACVVPTAEPVTENLIQWGREHPNLADHEQPREVAFFEDLPRSETGELQRSKLYEQLMNTR